MNNIINFQNNGDELTFTLRVDEWVSEAIREIADEIFSEFPEVEKLRWTVELGIFDGTVVVRFSA